MPGDDLPTDLGAERFRRANSATGLPPRAALDAAMRALDSGEVEPTHVVVLMATEQPEQGSVGCWAASAGRYNAHAIIGLVQAGIDNLRKRVR